MAGSEGQQQAGGAFLSYARADRALVAKLAAALEQNGIPLWWDHQLEGGAAFAKTIEKELGQAGAVIVAWSKTSIESDWVRDEAATGRDRGVLVPVTLDGTLPPLGFRQYHTIDLSGWSGDPGAPQIASLVRAATGVLGGERPERPGAPIPARGTTTRRRLLGGGAGVIGLGAAAYLLRGRLGGGGAVAPDNSIAVLPFANLSGSSDTDFFSDGLAEELRATLARFSQLQVAARVSSNRFKNSDAAPAEIGRQLGVAHLLEGSVRRAGNQVRVSAQLVDVETGFERWSQTFERTLDDVFAMQTGIATEVAEALKSRLLAIDGPRGAGGTADATAHDAYLRGRQLYDASTDEETYRRALDYFATAIASDPNYAAAHAARARTLAVIANQFAKGDAMRSLHRDALASAKRAVELAPDIADTQATLGYAHYSQLDFRNAAIAYAAAEKRPTDDADLLARIGSFKTRMGDFSAGVATLQRAALLDPLNPSVSRAEALVYFAAGRLEEAIAAASQALKLNPRINGAHGVIGDSKLARGDLQGALAEYRAEPWINPRSVGLAVVLKRLGQDKAARAAFDAMVAEMGDNSSYQQAQVLAAWGDKEGAVRALQAAVAAQDNGISQLRGDPMLASVRGDPRVVRIMAEVGFPA